MHRRAGNPRDGAHQVTRREVLTTGLAASFGIGAASLMAVTPPQTAAAAGVYGGSATVLNVGFPEVWDPHLAGTVLANAAISPMYNQVVEFNPINPREIIGDLAKSWEVQDEGLTYLFHLHEHVTWWDGKELTAEDVAFSIKRMVEPGKPRPRVGLLKPYVQQAEALNRTTVKVTLHYPSPAFLPFLAVDYMKVVPKHLLEAGVDINVWDNIVGSGPFRKKDFKRGDSVTYEKNPTYFKKGRPFLDRLKIAIISDVGTLAAAFRTGKVELTTGAFNMGIEDVLRLEPELKGTYTTYWQPVTNGQHFFVNVEREPWKDLRLIRALWLATDRHELIQAMGEGKFLLGAPFPVGSWYGSTEEALRQRPGYRIPKDADIEAAKALLKAAGYDPPATLGKRVLTTPRLEWFPDLAQLWVAQMRRNLGLDIDIKLVDGPTAITAFVAGDFDIGELGYAFNIDDPDDYVNAVYGPGARNYTRWKHPEFLRMFDQQSRERHQDKRRQILRQMEALLLDVQSPYIEVWWVPRFYLASDKVRTDAGAFITPGTFHVALKQEHWWLAK